MLLCEILVCQKFLFTRQLFRNFPSAESFPYRVYVARMYLSTCQQNLRWLGLC